MSIPNKRQLKRRPTHPGEMLKEDFLPEYGLSVSGLAEALRVSRQSINELVRERRAVSPEMALRLSRLFGNSAEFWLNAQRAVDLWDAAQAIKEDVARIKPLRVAKKGSRSERSEESEDPPQADRSSARVRIAKRDGDAGKTARARGWQSARQSEDHRALHGAGGSRTRRLDDGAGPTQRVTRKQLIAPTPEPPVTLTVTHHGDSTTR
jgi:antitoxin HigA-1